MCHNLLVIVFMSLFRVYLSVGTSRVGARMWFEFQLDT